MSRTALLADPIRIPAAPELRADTTLEQRAEKVLRLVFRHGNSLDGAEPRFGPHRARVLRALELGAPIELVMPAFPAKSPNREKTLGALPDQAEVLGLERLQAICDAIGELHAPGARLVICSDGRVFSDLVLVADEDVSAYGRAMREIIRDRNLRSLSMFSLENVFTEGDFDVIRARLVHDFGRDLQEIRAEAKNQPASQAMFNGIHRFVFEDRLILEHGKSRNRVREESKDTAYRVIQRSNAWSALVESLFPQALRLSIHPQLSLSPKIGFRLVDCDNAWGTPWHNVALLGPHGFRLVKRRDAEERGATLALFHGRYAYYREAGL